MLDELVKIIEHKGEDKVNSIQEKLLNGYLEIEHFNMKPFSLARRHLKEQLENHHDCVKLTLVFSDEITNGELKEIEEWFLNFADYGLGLTNKFIQDERKILNSSTILPKHYLSLNIRNNVKAFGFKFVELKISKKLLFTERFNDLENLYFEDMFFEVIDTLGSEFSILENIEGIL